MWEKFPSGRIGAAGGRGGYWLLVIGYWLLVSVIGVVEWICKKRIAAGGRGGSYWCNPRQTSENKAAGQW